MVSRTLSVGIFLMAGVSLSFVEVAAVHAQGEAPGGEAVRQRLDRVQAILDERADRARFWQYGWMGLGYAVTAGFATGSAITGNKANRLDYAFAAGGALIDTTVHAVDPINAHAAARLRAQPVATPDERRLKLKFAESELAAVAKSEAARQSLLKAHVLPNGIPVITGLVLWLGFGHLKGAAVNTAAAIVINELRVLTQPTSTIAAWTQYQRNPDGQVPVNAGKQATISWSMAAGPFASFVYGSF